MITRQQQPTRRSCGQTVVAMLLGVPAADVIAEMGDKGTSGKQLAAFLQARGFKAGPVARFRHPPAVDPRPKLPPLAIVRIDWGRDRKRTHWVLWAEKRFHDPLLVGDFTWAVGGGRLYSYMPIERPAST